MKKLLLFACLGCPLLAAPNVPLLIQEALYPGGSTGIARVNEPFCMGVPLADSEGIASVSSLGLAGATAGQFRILGRWPSGNAKWIEVCGIVPSLTAGGTASVILKDGTGDFGGPNLATDNGATITINTGAAAFILRKSNFNVVDSVVVDGKTVVASSSSGTRGLVLIGPNPVAAYPANVTCSADGVCQTVYSSANDAASSCTIEKNGPVQAVVRCIGTHKDQFGNPYMQFTAREYFHKGKSSIKVTSVLRNANFNTSSTPSPDSPGRTFNTAYKGFEAYELRIAPNITGTLEYTIANHTGTPSTGSINSSDSAYLYQGQSQLMVDQTDCPYQSNCANSYTTDTGYQIVKNGTAQTSGSSAQSPQGWADIRDSTGAGVQIGVYQMAAYFPKSLEFNGGGTDLRIGIYPRMNTKPVYQAWTAWNVHDLYLNFHATEIASPADEFVKFQHYLVARADRKHYNDSGVFPYPMPSAEDEDAFYTSVGTEANPSVAGNRFCCLLDLGTNSANWPLMVHRWFNWGAGGGPSKQEEFRWSNLQVFLRRGHTGRFLSSSHFYRMQAEKAWPHSDGTSAHSSIVNGFQWHDRNHAGKPSPELNGSGLPLAVSDNSSQALENWVISDYNHFHWYGMTDFYFLTGDETTRESMVSLKAYYLNPDTYQGTSTVITNGGVASSRAFGINMLGAARFSEYLQATGDPDWSAVLAHGESNYLQAVKPEPCVNGYPAGCTMPPLTSYPTGGYDAPGISRQRGVHIGPGSRGQGWCGDTSGGYRGNAAFAYSLVAEGLLALRRAKGPSWSDYNLSLDLAYGVSQYVIDEIYSYNGSSKWFDAPNTASKSLYNGFRYGVVVDRPQVCAPSTPSGGHGIYNLGGSLWDDYSLPVPQQGLFIPFYVHQLLNGSLTPDQLRKIKLQMQRIASMHGTVAADWGQYQLAAIIKTLREPTPATLQDIPFTLHNSGGGAYTLSWTVPAGTESYRIKWSPKIIAPSDGLLGYDTVNTGTFALDPARYSTWFGANTVNEPAPIQAGSTQSVAISAAVTGLTEHNFSIKAYIVGGASQVPAVTLSLISGNGQTGSAGQPLTSPLVVKLTNSATGPVAGALVTFTVTAGGGGVSSVTVATDAGGIASTLWTLGPTAGGNTVVVSASGADPVLFSATATGSQPQATNLALVSGDNQTGTVQQPLANPFIVRAIDANGNPLQAAVILFSVTAGGGTLSSTSATTNSQGLAAVTLTLGPTAGLHVVTATSGSLTITVSATAIGDTLGSPGRGLVWTKQMNNTTYPGFNGYLSLHYDPVSKTTLHYGIPKGSTSIYSTNMYSYDSSSNVWTDLGGFGSMKNTCSADKPDLPGDRHPVGQIAVDTKRNRLWIYGGANQTCSGSQVSTNGTQVTWQCCGGNQFHSSWAGEEVAINGITYQVTAVPDATHLTLATSAGVQTSTILQISKATRDKEDMYFLSLNGDPRSNRWTRVTPTRIPAPRVASGMVYVPDDDILFVFGSDGAAQTRDHWVYCPTDGTGVLTAKQSAAGCTLPDDWAEVKPTGVWPSNQPPGVAFPGLVYDSSLKKVFQYGGQTGGGVPQNQIWAYDVPTRTWARKCAGACTPPPVWDGSVPGAATAQPALAYNSDTGNIIYHQTSGVGAPADFEYDPRVDSWTKLASTGTGPTQVDAVMTYDVHNRALVTWSHGPDVWQATLSSVTGSPSRCDLNGDGKVNVVDVQLAIVQALGMSACGSADLNGDTLCTEQDITRIRDAALGGACQAGQ